MKELHLQSVSELRAGLDKGEFSSRELTQHVLNRIERFKKGNSFVLVCADEALKAADSADEAIKRGDKKALLGIPVGVKDVILTKGIRTTCCSKILGNFIPPYNATVTQKLLDQGAVIVGKTNMDEFAMGSSTENSALGITTNPWDESRVPGGSSGGSSAAVAQRLVPLALGTDTGGSIRQPAGLCGISGMKPTYGRVSRYGVIAYASSLDQVGGFAANVKDLSILMEAISGHDPLDSTSVDQKVPALLPDSKDLKGLRIGVPKEYFIDGLEPAVEKAVRDALKQFECLGAKVVEVSLPHTAAAVPTYYIIAPAEASSNLSRYDGVRYGHRASDIEDLRDMYAKSRSEGFGAEVKRRILIGTYVLSRGYYDAYYVRAQRVRTLIARDFQKAFETECDVIASPVAPSTAFRIGEKVTDVVAMYLNDVFTIPVNLAGLPGMSIPCGFDDANLPIGLQLIGKPWDEAGLLRVGHAYEQTTEWHKRLPPGAES